MTETRKATLIELRDKVKAGEMPRWNITAKALGLDDSDRHIKAFDAFSGSLDAAKALHEAVLPHYGWAIEMTEAAVWPLDTGGVSRDLSHNECPARAWLLAILEALILQEPDT